MILRVANDQNQFWDQFERDNIHRNSVSKSAMDSFTLQLALKAKEAVGRGFTVEHIAAGMRLPVKTVAELIQTDIPVEQERTLRYEEIQSRAKFASGRKGERPVSDDEKQAQSEYKQHLSAAEQAYNDLHGNKRAQAALKSPVLGHAKSVGMASQRGGEVTEVGGPKKYMKYDSANSIWDSEVLERNLKTKGNDERIKETNAKIAEQRMLRREAQHTIDTDTLREMLDNSEIRSDKGAYSYHAAESHNYNKNVQSNGMSIFDLWDGKTQPKIATSDSEMFTRIAAKTEGERAVEERRKDRNKPKDRSWVQQSAPKKMTSDIFQRMIDSVEGDE